MSEKKLNALETSKKLADFVLGFVENGLDRRFVRGSFDIIDTELKEKVQLEKIIKNQIKVIGYYENLSLKEKLESDKRGRALKLIREKGIDVDILVWSNNCGEYNVNARTGVGFTQEEYDLLNEVLL